MDYEGMTHSSDLKTGNTLRVRAALKLARKATVRDLANATGLSQVTVGSALQTLVSDGVAGEGDLIPSSGGRPSRVYRFRPDRVFLLVSFGQEIRGVDHLCRRVVDLYGDVVWGVDSPCDFRSLASLEPFFDEAIEAFPTIGALAFGLPGVERGGTIVSMDYRSLEGTRFSEHFAARYQRPVVVENDVNAAVLGTRGPGQPNTEVYLYAPLNNPPGAGVRIGNHLVRGVHGFAGEVGWLPGRPESWVPFEGQGLEAWLDSLARICIAMTVAVDPNRIVVWSESLDTTRLDEVRQRCAAGLPPWVKPHLELAASFGEDVARGVAQLGLELLEP